MSAGTAATPALTPAAGRPLPRQRRAPLSGTHAAAYATLTLGATATFVPFLWMLLAAFKPQKEIIAFPPALLPAQPTLENVLRVWTRVQFARYFANSLLVAMALTLIVLLTSAFVGYVLAKYRFPGREVLFICVLAAMMIPWPITILPRYQLMVWTGLINTLWALIVPGLFNSFGIFMMRQFMHGIPDELLDAARIDGASELRIFGQIVLPLTRPALAALAILEFIWSWESFIWPLLVLNSKSRFTLPIGLASFNQEFTSDFGALMGGALIAVLPMLVVYLLLQRYFVAGIALTGQKG